MGFKNNFLFVPLENISTVKKKKTEGDKLPAIPQLPTRAIKLRVNLPGLPWINQELSQGQAGQGEGGGGGDWQSSTSPKRLTAQQWSPLWRGHWENADLYTNKEALTGLPRLLLQAALGTENTSWSHISPGFLPSMPGFLPSMHRSSIFKEPREGVVFYRLGVSFVSSPDLTINICLSSLI